MQQNCQKWIKRYQQDYLAILLFLFLTIIASRPVLTQLNSVIVGDDNDVYINLWADWWTLKAVQEPDIEFWQTDYLFYPQGVSLSYHSFSHLNTLVSLTLRPLVGILPAYNLAILFNYVLAGLSMFQLARYATKSATAGIIAGIVFAFNSHNLYQSAHPVLISVWCFPWITLYFMRAVRENRIKWAIVTAGFVFLGASTSTLLLILIGIWLTVLTIYLFFATDWPRPSWAIVLTTSLLSAILVLPLIFPLLSDALVNNNNSFITDAETSIVADMLSPLIPHWRKWLIRGVYWGIVPFLLIVAAFKYARNEARLWFWLLFGSYLFAIGPRPEVYGYALDITLPWSLAIASILRNTYRVNILLTVALAMLAAYGWAALASRLNNKRVRQIIFIIIAALIFGEYTAVPFPHTPLHASSFYTEFLDDDDSVLAILPSGRQEDKKYLYYQTLHEHKMTGGIVSRASEETFSFINSNALLKAGLVDSGPVPEGLINFNTANVTNELRMLADEDVAYIVMHKELAYDGFLHIWRDWLTYSPIYEDDELIVYHTSPQVGRDFEIIDQLTDEIGLIRVTVTPNEAIQDGTIKIDLRFGSVIPIHKNYGACLELINDANEVAQLHCEAISPALPTSQWLANELVRGYYVLPVDGSIVPGSYTLALTLMDEETGEKVGKTAVLSQVTIHPFQPAQQMDASWGNLIYLAGYDLQTLDDMLEINFYWQIKQETDNSYKIFIHLVNSATGESVTQHDVVPRAWTYPTNIWEPDEIVKDSITLPLQEVPHGQYEIWVGLYDEITGERLPAVTTGNLITQDGAVLLTTMQRQ